MKRKVPRLRPRAARNGWSSAELSVPATSSNFHPEDACEPQIHVQDKSPRTISLDHVRMRPVVPANREPPGGAFVALVGPTSPLSFSTSVASPNCPSARIGSTATDRPK